MLRPPPSTVVHQCVPLAVRHTLLHLDPRSASLPRAKARVHARGHCLIQCNRLFQNVNCPNPPLPRAKAREDRAAAAFCSRALPDTPSPHPRTPRFSPFPSPGTRPTARPPPTAAMHHLNTRVRLPPLSHAPSPFPLNPLPFPGPRRVRTVRRPPARSVRRRTPRRTG